MTRNLIPKITLLLALPLSVWASAYLEPRASILHVSGTPAYGINIAKIDRADPASAVGLALGFELSPKLQVELRYTALGEIRADILSTQILPPMTGTTLVALHEYRFRQSRNLWAVALPIKVWEQDRLSLRLTPQVLWEDRRTELIRVENMASIPEIPPPPPLRVKVSSEHSSALRAAGELSLNYGLNKHWGISTAYTYAPLGPVKAQLISAGVKFSF